MMRLILTLWLATATLGVASYLVRYNVVQLPDSASVPAPVATEEAVAPPAATEDAVAPPAATEDLIVPSAATEDRVAPPAATEEQR